MPFFCLFYNPLIIKDTQPEKEGNKGNYTQTIFAVEIDWPGRISNVVFDMVSDAVKINRAANFQENSGKTNQIDIFAEMFL